MINKCETVDGIIIGRGTLSNLRKPAPMSPFHHKSYMSWLGIETGLPCSVKPPTKRQSQVFRWTESCICQYKIPSTLVTPESGFCYTTSDIRNLVDTFWPQFWNLWPCGGELRLQQLLISSWRARSTSHSVAPSHEGELSVERARKTTQCSGRKIVPLNLSSLLYIMLCL